ncbi:phosphoribosylglycinamide formyltransferase [Pelagibacterales bacterium SAG-MED15]|nr:phosphoribosylglycinamide formyltransferase [Pelagibacterales bacterium SAG-MED15]
MIKSFGKKTKIAVFISGRGSNLKNLINHSKKKNSKFQIDLIISNKKNAKGLIFAKKNNINFKIFSFIKLLEEEVKILDILKKKKIKIICLAGFMKILSKNFIKKFNGKILNIHPSLLPKYKGLNTHDRVLNNNDKYSGCTVHLVTGKLDSGKIILQKKVKVFNHDTSKTLEKRILKHEYLIYPKALNLIIS